MRIDALLASPHPAAKVTERRSRSAPHASARAIADRIELCRRMLVELDLPTPFPLRELLGTAARRNGKTLEVKARRMPPGMPTAFLVDLDSTIIIFCDNGPSPLLQHISIAHEVAHILFQHELPRCQPLVRGTASESELANSLLPTPPTAADLEREFGGLDEFGEQEAVAETFARLAVPMMSFPGSAAMRMNTAHLSPAQVHLSNIFDRRPKTNCYIRV
ncbi:hypothetical protein L3Q67_01875 [Saccharothrix sp. AJ9571]|nr:hypothetical protein L3Q67_01875 [Saccharothrix sp. AJ9571]